ncbi:diflavin oxidoreductase [Sunxiuqinia rutila]|uniref:diflavin oxidoreductase n=1 Tax=Sunxiuqinia rutila TaxID=1397841 RepID=UPI003D36078B
MTILYGGHSGNSSLIARETQKFFRKKKWEQRVVSMAKYDFTQLADEQHLVIIVSTHGEGEPPEEARRFYQYLHSGEAPRLEGVNFTVCALGDSRYAYFCQAGKDIDSRLESLGAERFYKRVDCDVAYHRPVSKWVSGVANAFQPSVERQPMAGLPEDSHYASSPALLHRVYQLNPESDSAIYHVELELGDPDFSYLPGDSVRMIPENPGALVGRVLDLLPASADTQVLFEEQVQLLSEVLLKRVELTSLSRGVLRRYWELGKHAGLEALLEDADQLKSYLEGRDVGDLLADFPFQGEPEQLLPVLRKIQPRLYSVAGSRAADPGKLHLTVKQVVFDFQERKRLGACSNFLTQQLKPGANISVELVPNENFRLPEQADVPVIMIAAGTGIAPFRAFMEERAWQHPQSRNWLFFGEKNSDRDFLYREDWERWKANGVLSRITLAFSRDQEKKVYVQHRLREQAKEVGQWLKDGAHVYVCGSVAMGQEVTEVIEEVLELVNAQSPKENRLSLDLLREAGRWHVDVY